MPAYSSTSATPRNEIAAVIQQGVGMNMRNIWSKVLPLYATNRRVSHLLSATIANASLLRIMADKFIRSAGANFERITLTFGDSTITLVLRGQEVLIPDETEMDFAGYFSVEAFAGQRAADMIEATFEYLTATAIFNTTNFGSATNSATAYTTANLATMTPIEDINLSIERVLQKGEVPNTIIIPGQVWARIRQSTNVRSAILGPGGLAPTSSAAVTTDALQKYFEDQGITQVLIGTGRYNTADDGATASFTKYWANTYIWVGRCGDKFIGSSGDDAPMGGIPTINGVGANVFWEDYTPGNGLGVETYRDEARKSNVVRGLTSVIPYMANTNAGDLIGTQYS